MVSTFRAVLKLSFTAVRVPLNMVTIESLVVFLAKEKVGGVIELSLTEYRQ